MQIDFELKTHLRYHNMTSMVYDTRCFIGSRYFVSVCDIEEGEVEVMLVLWTVRGVNVSHFTMLYAPNLQLEARDSKYIIQMALHSIHVYTLSGNKLFILHNSEVSNCSFNQA